MPITNNSYTERGFRNYGEFVDSYGNTITVRESSSAEEQAAWIFCHKPDGADFSPHLNKSQLQDLIEILTFAERNMEEVE